MLTARKAMKDEEECFSYGAEDYIVKPFRTGDLIARVKVVLRRHEKAGRKRGRFISGELEIVFDSKKVIKKGSDLKLTPKEYYLLAELAANAGKVLSIEHLLHEVWGPEYSDERQYIHEYIKRLRTKIEADPQNPVYIISDSKHHIICVSSFPCALILFFCYTPQT